jgi:hypothetical protein
VAIPIAAKDNTFVLEGEKVTRLWRNVSFLSNMEVSMPTAVADRDLEEEMSEVCISSVLASENNKK